MLFLQNFYVFAFPFFHAVLKNYLLLLSKNLLLNVFLKKGKRREYPALSFFI